MTQLDLLTYPNRAGWKKAGPSKAAADSIDVSPGQQSILDALQDFGPMTADECAGRINRSILYARPRCSELAAKNLIEDTGATRPNDSGLGATVWRVKA